MRLRPIPSLVACSALLLGMLVAARATDAAPIVVTVGNVNWYGDNIRVNQIGATTSYVASQGYYVVGPAGDGGWNRPIIPFDADEFSELRGTSLVSATLHYNISTDFAEDGESFFSEVRLFSTNEIGLSDINRDVFAGLTGDGAMYSVVGSASLVHGVTGPQALEFSADGLAGLEAAISSGDATIGIAFREFAGDFLDEFAFDPNPGAVSIVIVAVPEPTSAVLVSLGLATVGLARRRRPLVS